VPEGVDGDANPGGSPEEVVPGQPQGPEGDDEGQRHDPAHHVQEQAADAQRRTAQDLVPHRVLRDLPLQTAMDQCRYQLLLMFHASRLSIWVHKKTCS